MSLAQDIKSVSVEAARPKHVVFNDIVQVAHKYCLTIDDVDINKPWGWYVRFEPSNAERFVEEFFPELDINEARLDNPDAPLSPKFLLVTPGEMLSWQYHDRRAERWAYVTQGAYYRSKNDEMGELKTAEVGDIVQFAQGERHRLVCPGGGSYTLVAEIWQHTDPGHLSDESDIVRVEDKYYR